MTEFKQSRLGWLARRLSRITPAEVPYRVLGVLRGVAQGRGWFDASQVPALAADARLGPAWVARPLQLAEPAAIVAAADRLLRDGLPVFDVVVPLNDGAPAWNRDPKTGTEIGLGFGLDIDFRHLGEGVDIKYLWELNRHLWWVTLAQAYSVTGQQRYLDVLARLIDSWLTACPYARGANWSSPVEHGIRLINWSIVWHLLGGAASPLFAGAAGARLRQRWQDSIYQHIRFASDNYSFYSSSDNHLIGEAAGVLVGALTWDLWDAVRPLARRARAILEAEMLKQFAPDGVNLEQALCYHKFSLEFMLASVLTTDAAGAPFSAAFLARMRAAIGFLAAMMDSRGAVPGIGDADDGKVFSFAGAEPGGPYVAMLRSGAALFGSRQLAAKLAAIGHADTAGGNWLRIAPPATPVDDGGAPLPTRFTDGGYLVMGRDLHTPAEVRLTMDVGALGYNRIAGHGHADALMLLLSAGGDEFLVDPGTYCYNAAPALRHYFRGTAAHNTAMVDGLDQSLYGGSFLWLRDIHTTLAQYDDDGVRASATASHDGYQRLADPVRHERSVRWDGASGELVVVDRFHCAQPHQVRLHWHLAPECALAAQDGGWLASRAAGQLAIQPELPAGWQAEVVSGQETPPLGWVSRAFYQRQVAPVLVCSGTVTPGMALTTRFLFTARPQ
jgi:hypothetical protein